LPRVRAENITPYRWPLILLLLLGIIAVAYDTSRTVGPRTVRPLVSREGWSFTGQAFRYPVPISALEVPASIIRDDSFVGWRTWSPETGGTAGKIETAPFATPSYIAIPYVGFPGEVPGNYIVLRCETDGRELNVARLRTNTQWATTFLDTKDFCAGPLRLVASASGKTYFIGVGTPYEISADIYNAQTQFGPRALVVIGCWALMLIMWVACAGLAGSIFEDIDDFAAGFVATGVLGMAILAAFTVAPTAGRWLAFAIVVGTATLVGVGLWQRPLWVQTFLKRNGPAFLLWLGIALALTGFVSAADSGGGSWAINGLFSPLRWSTDNQLPMFLADGLWNGVPPNQIVAGPWLATDRTPLLSAMLLLPREFVIAPLARLFGTTFVSIGYMMCSITILSAWAAVAAWFCRKLEIRSIWIVLILLSASPFLLFNTVYVWPKILGASYVVAAFNLLSGISSSRENRAADLVLTALCAVLAYLSHASNLFALIPVAICFAGTIFRAGYRPILAAALASVALYLPWAYWQLTLQPGGNALLRYAFTGEFDLNQRKASVLTSALRAYGQLGLAGWLRAKLNGLKMLAVASGEWLQVTEMARFSPGTRLFGADRVSDFFVVARTVGVSILGSLFLFVKRLTPGLTIEARSVLRTALLVGAGGILVVMLATLLDPIVIQLGYGSIFMLLIAGACGISGTQPRLALPLTAIAIAYAAFVWIGAPLVVAERIFISALVGACFGLVLIVVSLLFLSALPGYREELLT
jgi:hypothetical protein